MTGTEDSERRNVGRVHFVADVNVTGLSVVRSTDLSCGGIYLSTVTGYAEGTLLLVSFKLEPTDEKPIEVRCRVLYSHPSIGFGLRFENLTPEDKYRIEEYVTTRSQESDA